MTVLAGLGRADEEVQFDPLPVLAVAAESLECLRTRRHRVRRELKPGQGRTSPAGPDLRSKTTSASYGSRMEWAQVMKIIRGDCCVL